MEQPPTRDSSPAAGFPTTRWSRVAAARDPASPSARAALADLCAAYWYPIYALIRRGRHSSDEAADLAQDYFARLLMRGTLAAADREKGRLRAFLRTDCGFFLADRRDRDRARKRGGGRPPLSIDARDAEGRYLVEPSDGITPERLFERDWAVTILDLALRRMAEEARLAGRSALFERLRDTLAGGPGAVPLAEVAADLQMTEAAVKKAAQRLRKRYSAVLREEIADTLDDPSDEAIEEEIRTLFAALGA